MSQTEFGYLLSVSLLEWVPRLFTLNRIWHVHKLQVIYVTNFGQTGCDRQLLYQIDGSSFVQSGFQKTK